MSTAANEPVSAPLDSGDGIPEVDEKYAALEAFAGKGPTNIARWLLADEQADAERISAAQGIAKRDKPDITARGMEIVAQDIRTRIRDERRRLVNQVRENLKSYGSSKPTGEAGRKVLEKLTRKLRELGVADPSAATRAFEMGSYDQFRASFPEHLKNLLPPSETAPISSPIHVSDDDLFHPFWRRRNLQREPLRIERNRINQKFYYLSPESANNWKELTRSGQYSVYNDCCDTLNTFLSDQENWINYVRERKLSGVVMLGGGAAEKDLKIINSMLAYAPDMSNIDYRIVDISTYMLEDAVDEIDRNLIKQGRRSRVHLEPFITDFMNLKGTRPRAGGGSVAWFMPGATIGNLDERAFFRSLKQEAKAGDFLVIGTDVIEPHAEPNVLKSICEEKYKAPQVRGFLENPLRAAWHELNLDTTLNDAFDELQVGLVEDYTYTDVPGTLVVRIYIRRHDEAADEDGLTIITSAKYKEENFLAFSALFKFEHLATFSGGDAGDYRYFVFRYFPT